jgi:hypothetical protein
MPVSKKAKEFTHKWTSFIADEFNIPAESLWITDMSGDRTFVYIWTEKLGKGDYERISGFKSGGGHLSTRGKLSRFLDDLNADGWFTKVKPSEAGPGDLFAITPTSGEHRVFCTGTDCRNELFGYAKVHRQKCDKCAKVARI